MALKLFTSPKEHEKDRQQDQNSQMWTCHCTHWKCAGTESSHRASEVRRNISIFPRLVWCVHDRMKFPSGIQLFIYSGNSYYKSGKTDNFLGSIKLLEKCILIGMAKSRMPYENRRFSLVTNFTLLGKHTGNVTHWNATSGMKYSAMFGLDFWKEKISFPKGIYLYLSIYLYLYTSFVFILIYHLYLFIFVCHLYICVYISQTQCCNILTSAC